MPAQRDYDFERIYTPVVARASEYGHWIASRAPWQLFGTWTIKDLGGDALYQERKRLTVSGGGHGAFTHIGVAGAERFIADWFRREVKSRAYSSGRYRPYAAIAMEYHLDRVTPHFHGLVGGVPEWMVRDTMVGKATRRGGFLYRSWFRDHGRVRLDALEKVAGQEYVGLASAIYASKYMTKDNGKFYALGAWPRENGPGWVSLDGDEEGITRQWDVLPGSGNAERVWRELCDGSQEIPVW